MITLSSPARRDQGAAPALRLLRLALALSMAAAPLTGRAAPPAGPGSRHSHTVSIENLRFEPQVLTVHRGDRVTWINRDPIPHTVTSKGKFDSHLIQPDGSWTYVARRMGEYAYVCTLHVTMKGKLEVR